MSRRICFTYFTDEHDREWELPKGSTYMCVQHEQCPSSSRFHYQGYIEFESKMRFDNIKRRIGIPGIHLERCRGSQEHNITYCSKMESRCELCDRPIKIIGDPKQQGKRSDLEDIKEHILKGSTEYSIFTEHPGSFIRYHKGIAHAMSIVSRESTQRFREIDCVIWWGDTGTGKTRRAYEEFPELYKLDHSENQLWWDGYRGQTTLLIDDFYGYIRYSLLLQLLDRYPMRLAIKGGHTYANWTTVIITSNQEWTKWYEKPSDQSALRRRITRIEHFNKSLL